MKLSEKILTLRKKQGLSQEELAADLGVSRQAVSRWESGSALPDASNVLQLSRLFKVTADYLLNDDYDSDMDVPAVKTAERTAEQSVKNKFFRIVEAALAGIGLLGNFIIYIISRCVKVEAPLKYYNEAEKMTMYQYDGVPRIDYGYFISEYHLGALVAVLTIMAAAGIIMILRDAAIAKGWISKYESE